MGANLDSLLQKIAAGATPWKQAVRVVAAGNITLSALQTIDGVTVEEGDRVLCAGQTAPAERGIYTASAGAWSRAIDMDRDSYAKLGTAVHVMAGTSNAGEVYFLTAPATGSVRVGVTSQTWTKYAPAAGSPFPLDDGMGNTIDVTAGTTSIVTASDGLRLVSGSTLDIDLDSANDIFLDVGANADVIHIAAAGTDKLTITPGASSATIATPAGSALSMTIDSDVDLTISSDSAAGQTTVSGQAVDVTASTGRVGLIVNSVEARLTESGGALTLAPQDAALTVQPTAAAAGVGKAVTVKAGSGASGSAGGVASLIGGDGVGTNIAAGDALVYGGTPTGSGAVGGVRFGNGATYGTRYRSEFSTNYFTSQLGGGHSFDGSGGFSYTAGSAVTFVSSLLKHQGAARQWANASAVNVLQEATGSVAISSATTTTVASYTTESNRVYQVIAAITVSNDTDNEGATYWLRAAFKNVAGVVTQIGATQTIAADLEDAGQTGLAGALDFSGTAIRARLTTDAADTVNANAVLHIYERVLA